MRSRIAAAAVAASLVTGLAACSSTSKGASDGAAGAPGAPGAATSTATTSAPATDTGTAAATSAASAPTSAGSSSGSTTALSGAGLSPMHAKVGSVFSYGVTTASTSLTSGDVAALAADFDSKATMAASWGSGADHPMDCGMPKYNGVVIGMVHTAAGSSTVPVLLYQNAKPNSVVVTVTVDPDSGVIKGTTCGGAVDPADFPGVAPIAAYYGAWVGGDLSVVNDKSQPYFTHAFATWKPADMDYDPPTCSQGGSDRWVVALNSTAASSSGWDFAPGTVLGAPNAQTPGNPVGFNDTLAVDLGTNKISRVTCFSAHAPKPDTKHAANYAQSLLDFYRLAADQKTLGVDAEALIRPSFASDSAFTKAWKNTGTVPLLCTKVVPGSVMTADGTTVSTSGSRTTVKMVTWPQWHPDDAGQEASKFTVVFDSTSLKIESISCTK